MYLTQVAADGKREEVEVRPCVFSEINRNHKIEVRAAKGKEYPNEEPPILVFRERQLRTFDYMLLMPDEIGYSSLMELTDRLPSLGKGLRRVISDMNTLEDAWPYCPLLASTDTDKQEV